MATVTATCPAQVSKFPRAPCSVRTTGRPRHSRWVLVLVVREYKDQVRYHRCPVVTEIFISKESWKPKRILLFSCMFLTFVYSFLIIKVIYLPYLCIKQNLKEIYINWAYLWGLEHVGFCFLGFFMILYCSLFKMCVFVCICIAFAIRKTDLCDSKARTIQPGEQNKY